MEELLYELVSERAGEILREFGYDTGLSETHDEIKKLLEPEIAEKVDAVLTRTLQSKFDDLVSVYRGGFRDGLRYGIEIMSMEQKIPFDKKIDI